MKVIYIDGFKNYLSNTHNSNAKVELIDGNLVLKHRTTQEILAMYAAGSWKAVLSEV